MSTALHNINRCNYKPILLLYFSTFTIPKTPYINACLTVKASLSVPPLLILALMLLFSSIFYVLLFSYPPILSSGLNIMVSVPLFTMYIIAAFCMNFSFINKVLWVPQSNILTIANPNISSINRAFTFIDFCSLGFKIM